MSIPLPTVNLTGVSINQSGTVSFQNTGISAGGVSANPVNVKNAGTVLIYNESGSGLLIKFQQSGSGFYLPAGAWQPIPIGAGETGYTWTVIYNLPSPPVTLLLTTYYYPGEPLPPQPTLGNSPIGIGGTVQTASPLTFFSVPSQIITNDSITGGSSKTYSVTGAGVPSNAQMVFITFQCAAAIANTYAQIGPSGGLFSGLTYPQVMVTQTTSIQSFGGLCIPVNTVVLDGKIEVLANNNNLSSINAFVYGYSL